MIRDYDGQKDSTATPNFFTGNEVEKTNCEGMKTLFVVGLQKVNEILETAKLNDCLHIYLGANQSFKGLYPIEVFTELAVQVFELTNAGLYVTLDTNVVNYALICKAFQAQVNNKRFTINISVPIEHIEMFRNVYIKIDDTDFNNTNSGVWIARCDPKTFTPWAAYTNDSLELTK